LKCWSDQTRARLFVYVGRISQCALRSLAEVGLSARTHAGGTARTLAGSVRYDEINYTAIYEGAYLLHENSPPPGDDHWALLTHGSGCRAVVQFAPHATHWMLTIVDPFMHVTLIGSP
jgi:hypothetical protein